MQTERSDEAWVEALRARGPSASHDVVADLRDFLRRTLAKGFGQKLAPADLEDLAQESLLRVHGKLESFQGQSRFTTWKGCSPPIVWISCARSSSCAARDPESAYSVARGQGAAAPS